MLSGLISSLLYICVCKRSEKARQKYIDQGTKVHLLQSTIFDYPQKASCISQKRHFLHGNKSSLSRKRYGTSDHERQLFPLFFDMLIMTIFLVIFSSKNFSGQFQWLFGIHPKNIQNLQSWKVRFRWILQYYTLLLYPKCHIFCEEVLIEK